MNSQIKAILYESYSSLIALYPFMSEFLKEEDFKCPRVSVIVSPPCEYFNTLSACSSTEAHWLDTDGNILAQAGSVLGPCSCKEALDDFVSEGGDRSQARYLLHMSKTIDWKIVLYKLE